MDHEAFDASTNSRSDDLMRAIAKRRLAQIAETLRCDPNALSSARADAAAALGANDLVVAEQLLQVTRALVAFADPFMRANAVEVFVAAATYKALAASAEILGSKSDLW